MIAKETYRLLRSVVGPWFKQNDFKVAKSSYLTYQKPVAGPGFFIVRFQCHYHGWEKYKGSSFTVLVQLGPQAALEERIANRLTAHLSLPELELVRARQNRVLRAIPPPPPEYVNDIVAGFGKSFKDPRPYIERFLEDWRPVAAPYSAGDDIWFRYFSEDDVRSWAILLLNHLRALHERWLAHGM